MDNLQPSSPDGAIPGGSSPSWDEFWDPLLRWVEDGSVIPIIGQDLLVLEIGGRRVSLGEYLAERLAEALGQEPPTPSLTEPPLAEPLTLNRVIYRFLKQEKPKKLDRIYLPLADFLEERGANAIPVPRPLHQLAEILPFRMFVTTTFDPLLERALRQVRAGEPLEVRSYSVKDWNKNNDLPYDFDPRQGTFVYHLLGRLSNKVQDFAVTEEDLLEFFHSLNRRPPESLFGELESESKHLLIVGSSFSEWLARFFIRLPTLNERLWNVQSKRTDFLADPRLQADVTLGPFLESFCGHATSFRGGDVVAFVDELHKRWVDRGRRSLLPATIPSAEGKIFISYAHQDAKVVDDLRALLTDNKLAVWIDSERLRGGETFAIEIRRAVEQCLVFIPIVSKNTRDERERYYRQEWDWALQRRVLLPANRELIVPVAIDDEIQYDDETLPEGLRKLTWIRLSGGTPTDAFVSRIREVFRKAQQRPQRNGE